MDQITLDYVALNTDALARLSSLALDVIAICAAISVLVVMLVESLKQRLRAAHNERILYEWFQGLQSRTHDVVFNIPSNGSEYDYPISHVKQLPGEKDLRDRPLASIFDADKSAFQLPKRLFMRRLQLSTQKLMDSPSESMREILVLSAGASLRDQLEFQKWVDKVSYDGGDLPPHIELKSRRIASALERNLDELQLLLTQTWRRRLMAMAIAVGAGVFTVLFIYTLLWRNVPAQFSASPGPGLFVSLLIGYAGTLFFGIVTGVFSTFVYDTIVRVSGRRTDIA